MTHGPGFWKFIAVVFALFASIALVVGIKFTFEDRLGPATRGLSGELKHAPVKLLLVGSSHTMQSYDIRELEKDTGVSAFSVSYSSLDMTYMVPVIKAAFADPAKRPKLLVLEAYSYKFGMQPALRDTQLFFDAPPAAKLEMLRTYAAENGGWRHSFIKIWVLVVNRGGDVILTYPLLHRKLNSTHYNGSYLDRTSPGYPAAQFDSLRLPSSPAVPDPENMAGLLSILLLARENNVHVIMVATPMPAPVEAQPNVRALEQSLRDIAAHAGVTYYHDPDFPLNDPAMFYDNNHLSTAGRELNTRQFAQELMSGRLAKDGAALQAY